MAAQVVEGRHLGMINKYLGDGFMALFGAGANESLSNHAQDAFDAGREILHSLNSLNQELTVRKHPLLAIGIGINSGLAIVGSIGSPQRLEFTAIGSNVNLASRIENLTKQVGAPLLVTYETRIRLQDATGLVELPPQPVRGVDGPVKVFALTNSA
jgi:adenylate cyclase